MFNDYVWSLYKDVKGKEIVETFEENISKSFSKEYSTFISKLHSVYCPSVAINKDIRVQLDDILYNEIQDGLIVDALNGVVIDPENEESIDLALRHIINELSYDDISSDQIAFDIFSGNVSYFTTILAMKNPYICTPYYFTFNFNVLEIISKEFGLILPEVPVKKDYTARLQYYGKLCRTFYEFRKEHGMTPYQFFAFLYDFAPKYVGGYDSYIIKDLPQAKAAYFIGGSKDDIFLSDDMDYPTPWQCSPDTDAGDNIVLYLRSPISAIDSVWRSVSVGFNDPFFYYYRCTYIDNCTHINRISLNQLRKDPALKELPIVRKNMQGINGVALLPSTYNRILDLGGSELERITYDVMGTDLDIQMEKDVEEKLVAKLLLELGYSENDYIRQLYIKVGNNNQLLIPDFVINPVSSPGHQKADFIIEVKYSLLSKKAVEKAKIQARGYAKILNAKYSVLASKERVWVMGRGDDYSESILSFTWEKLKEEDNFFELYKIIGKNQMN